MNLPLEVSLPYRLLALFVLAVFYGIYLVKQWRQKRRGIRTIQIGRRKDTQTHTVETLMGIATVGIIPAQLLSITFGWSHLPSNARFTGFCIGSYPFSLPRRKGLLFVILRLVDLLPLHLVEGGIRRSCGQSMQNFRNIFESAKDFSCFAESYGIIGPAQ